ncbi:MAG: hypothetical protein SPL30_10450 [Succinivibrio sp.]|jgi:hypothetical protein|nr:hypothetical protein [Succinivibrio sp.]
MEVASYAANIAPPVFSQSVEEAKRDNYARQTIPQPQNSQNSQQSGEALSQGTTGTNSSLYAQTEGLIRAADDKSGGKGGRQDKSSGKEEKGRAEARGGASVAQAAKSSGAAAAARVSSGSFSAAESASQSVSASFAGAAASADSKSEKSEIRKAGMNAFARFSAQALSSMNGDDQLHARAVATRYNGILSDYRPGINISVRV